MSEFLQKFDSGEIIALVAITGGLIVGLAASVGGIIGGVWQNVRKAEIEGALKQDMLNRGMSAEDIRTVMEAGSKKSWKALASRRCC